MPTLHELTSGTAIITLHFGDLPITVDYCPGKVTEEFIGQVLAFNRMDEATFEQTFSTFNTTFCEIINHWDITENDGVTMFPLDPARMPKLPLTLRVQIAQEIMGAMRPNGEAPKTQS